MKNARLWFHRASYLQYPFFLMGVFYAYRPLLSSMDMLWVDLNKGLVFLGLGISLSTLQDTTKTQNNFSKRIFQNERYSKVFMVVLIAQILLYTLGGLWAFLMMDSGPLYDLSFGLISVGIGMIGLLKGAIEIASHLQSKTVLEEPHSSN